MGAALGAGCGMSKEDGTPGGGPGGAGGTTALGGTGGVAGAQQAGRAGTPSAAGTGNVVNIPCSEPGLDCSTKGGGTPETPLGPSDCAMPQQFAFAGVQHTCSGEPAHYECDVAAPLVPTDCAQTYQFDCADYTSNCGCYCDASAPGDVSACTAGANPVLECHAYDPPVGCSCAYLAPAIL